MRQFLDWLAQSQYLVLVPVVALVIAASGLILSLFSIQTSRRAVRIAAKQEARRQEKLTIDAKSLFVESSGGDNVYTCQIEARNTADRANSVVRVEIEIAYMVNDRPVLGVFSSERATSPELALLADIPANQSRIATINIRVPRTVTDGNRIDYTTIVITDTFDTRYPQRFEHVGSPIAAKGATTHA